MLGFEKYNSEWWFVMPYMVLMMLTPLLLRFLSRKKANFFTDFLVILGLALFSMYGMEKCMAYDMFETFSTSVWGILFKNVMSLLPVYLAGMVFARYQVFSYYARVLPQGILRYPLYAVIAFAGFYLRYKLGASYDFFLAGPMIFSVVMLLKKIPGIVPLAQKLGRYITLVWLIHTFYIFQFGQRVIYAAKNPILIFFVAAVLSFASAAVVSAVFGGLKRGYGWIVKKRDSLRP
jgi:hypothetical protein